MNGIDLLIFDLDGTLVDSRRDLVDCINATLLHCTLPRLDEDQIASFIGDGVAALVERSLAAAGARNPKRLHEDALAFFLSHYREHLLDHTHVYPGVLAALSAIRAFPEPPLIAVLTNKPVNPSQRICDALHLTPFLFANYGGNSFGTKKPDPEGLFALRRQAEHLRGHSIRTVQIAMIGDSEVDIRTARNAGVASWGCTWGFAPEKMLQEEPDWLAHSPGDWVQLFAHSRRDISPAG